MNEQSETEAESLEKAIVDRLTSVFGATIPVEAFPDAPEDFKKLPVQRGIVLVGYRGTYYSEPTNTDTLIQETSEEFAVTLEFRNLRHQGAYLYLNQVKNTLTGFCPAADRRPLYPVEKVFLRMSENLWIWGMTFRMKSQSRQLEPVNDAQNEEPELPVTARGKIVAYLKGIFATAGFAFVTRRNLTIKEIRDDQFPALVMLGGTEECQTINLATNHVEARWPLELRIFVLAAPGRDAQDAIDSMMSAAVKAVSADDSLGGTAEGNEVIRKVPDLRVFAPYAACAVQLVISYRYNQQTQGG
jgi:hypothetical protein